VKNMNPKNVVPAIQDQKRNLEKAEEAEPEEKIKERKKHVKS